MRLPLITGLAIAAAAPAAFGQASTCLASIDAGLAADVRAATARSDKQSWDEVEKLGAEAEQAWREAAAKCPAGMREKAQANLDDARRIRVEARAQAAAPACDQAFASATRMMDFIQEAWAAKRWEEAAMWSRKVDLAWESALGQCSGARRDQADARRVAARLDAHNAAVCAPAWDKATERSSALKADMPVLSATEKIQRRDEVETLWGEAAALCKGIAAERAAGTAAVFARERGSRALSGVSRPAASTPAPAGRDEAIQAEGLRYIGRFQPDADGNMNGNGRIEWENGDVFEGSLVAGKAQGKGTFAWKSGQRYEGDLAGGRPAGQGKMTFAGSGDRYEGAFVDGVPHGQGVYTWKNGDVYAGGWANGRKHGRGKYTWASGKSWEGEYDKDRRLDAANGPLALAAPRTPVRDESAVATPATAAASR